MKKDVIVIIGPTASGKTSLSLELAKKINGEIISADSMQIYKELNIGTSKVTNKEMQGIKHYMVDIVDMKEEFSVYDFKTKCYEYIEEIISKNKTPIIVGGTGLYVSSVIKDMNFIEQEIDEKYRKELYELAKNNGNNFVHEKLKEVDYESYKNIHPNNLKRVIRALEMYKLGQKKSDHIEKEKNIKNSKYNFHIFCIDWNKEILHERINKRVDIMIREGLEKEAKLVYNSKCKTARQAIGYKEFFDYFKGEKSLDEVIEEIKLRTRQYSKRQLTWFKKMDDVVYLKGSNELGNLINNIMESLINEKK